MSSSEYKHRPEDDHRASANNQPLDQGRVPSSVHEDKRRHPKEQTQKEKANGKLSKVKNRQSQQHANHLTD
jgi:hypothetical protein